LKKILSLLFFLILGALLTEGFQCASPELTTAKLAIRNKEWKKAEMNLESAVAKNSKENEAWILLAQVKEELGKYEEEANIIKQASKNVEDKTTKATLNDMERKLWYHHIKNVLTNIISMEPARTGKILTRLYIC